MSKVNWWEWALPPVALTHAGINLAKGDSPESTIRDIPLLGNLAGNTLFGPDMSGIKDASADAKAFYENYAPQQYAARQQALGQVSQLFQAPNDMLTNMYGLDPNRPQAQQQALWDLPEPVASPAPYGTGPIPTVGVPGSGGVPIVPGKKAG